MKKFIILVVGLLPLFSCKEQTQKSESQQIVVASYNGMQIEKSQLDSIISEEIYQTKMNAMNQLIGSKLIEEASETKGISSYDLITSFYSKNLDSLMKIELKNNNYNRILISDSARAAEILKIAEYQVKYKGILNKLLLDSKIEIFIEKDFHREFGDSLKGSYMYSSGKGCCGLVTVISNYECGHCYDLHCKLKDIIIKNNSKTKFKFVYYGDRILKFAKAPLAAENQGFFNEMNDFVFEKVQNGSINDSLIYNYAKELKMDIERFKNDYFSATISNDIESNKRILIANNIFSTPTLIINGRIYDEPNIYSILKNKLNNEK